MSQSATGRFRETPPEEMPPAQKEAYLRMVEGPRGRVPMPYRMWLSSPELVKCLEPLGVHFKHSALTRRESEIVILVTAQQLGAPFVVNAHARLAAEEGIDATAIEAMRSGATPALPDARERMAWELTKALNAEPQIASDLHDRAVATLGHQAIADLTALIGYYVGAAAVLKFYAVPVPAAAPR